jgi:hypothetical protein
MIAPKRRWFRWSLRTMFVAVTVVACWLGWLVWQVQIVQERKATAQRIRVDGGGVYTVCTREEAPGIVTLVLHDGTTPRSGDQIRQESVGRVRQWLGDLPATYVDLSVGSTELEVQRAKAVFPESEVSVGKYTHRKQKRPAH